MSLTVAKQADEKQEIRNAVSAALLNKYLAGVVRAMDGRTKSAAEKIAAEHAAKADMKMFSAQTVEAKEAETAKQMKKYGMREKMNFAADGKALEDNPGESISQAISMAVASSATMLTLAVSAGSGEITGLGAVMAGIGGAYTVNAAAKAAIRHFSRPKNEEQTQKAAAYTELKHAQMALKQLKKVLQAPEKAAQKAEDREMIARLYASGLGNPGGMVTPVSLAKKDLGR